MSERIVITGMGAISPLGLTAKESWENALNGVSGLGPITRFDTSDYLVNIACEVKGFDPKNYMNTRDARRRDLFQQYAIAAAQEAIHHAGIEVTEANAGRVGVVLSSAIGGLKAFQDAAFTLEKSGPRKISPFAIPMLMSNGAAGLIGIEHGFQGPAFSVASACASGADGIGMAWMMLKAGMIDVAIAGASETPIEVVGVGSFDRLGAMSRRADDPHTPQPFDMNRDGLVMGEGAAVLVLERESHARQRGAVIIAELAGYGSTADANHITAPAEDGAGGAKAMQAAIQSAGINPEQVGYINAHGTATPLNDAAETRAIKTAFGDLAYNIPISSTKSMTGHMMGATGALEALFCAHVVAENVVPPTINYQTPDPECDLDYIPNQAREAPVEVAISNSFGFGGHNAVLAVKKYNN
jgi:3-oxoacyl-[acyl-carrier-protein] synthase II